MLLQGEERTSHLLIKKDADLYASVYVLAVWTVVLEHPQNAGLVPIQAPVAIGDPGGHHAHNCGAE
jgi:hypothetical protein